MSYRSVRVETPGTYVTECFTRQYLHGPLFFRTALPYFSGYHLERGLIPLHYAVGIICKLDETTENQGAGDKYMG